MPEGGLLAADQQLCGCVGRESAAFALLQYLELCQHAQHLHSNGHDQADICLDSRFPVVRIALDEAYRGYAACRTL